MINIGLLVGNKNLLSEILHQASELIEETEQEFYGLDQAILNYVIRRDSRGISLPEKYNYLILLKINELNTINKKFYNKNKELIKIVHNLGGYLRLFPDGKPKLFEIKKNYKKLPGSFWGITTLFSPCSYKSRTENYRIFREYSKKQGLKLITLELAFENQEFVLKKEDADILIQLRTNDILWHKESLLNIGLKNLPDDCDKFCWIDADVVFSNNNWVHETSKLLEKYPVVQPFSYVTFLNKNEKIDLEKISQTEISENQKKILKGVAFLVSQIGKNCLELKKRIIPVMFGICWAFRRDLFEKTGFFDKNILSSSDTLMTYAFYNISKGYFYYQASNEKMRESLDKWKNKIYPKIKGSVFYTPGIAAHLYHGKLEDREYFRIESLLRKYDFDPEKDLLVDENNLHKWSNNKPELKQKIKEYFISRNDDELLSIHLKKFLKKNPMSVLKEPLLKIIGKTGKILAQKSPVLFYKLKKASYRFLKTESTINNIFSVYWNDYQMDPFPFDRRMSLIDIKKVEGMSSENVRFLINELVKTYAKNGIYLEIGTYQGLTLLSAALYNDSTTCIGVDDFSMFNEKNNELILNKNLSEFYFLKNILFFKGKYQETIPKIFSKFPEKKINVYFYDADHSYKSQLENLNLILPYLAEKCIIIIDDANWKEVEKANKDFVRKNPDFKILYRIRTNEISSNWWNGLDIITRGF